jgi:hypothetical protein
MYQMGYWIEQQKTLASAYGLTSIDGINLGIYIKMNLCL